MINEEDKKYLLERQPYFFYEDFADFSERVSIMMIDGGVSLEDAQDFAFKSLMKQKELREIECDLKYDEEEFNLMVEKGTKAWADVPDINSWLEEIRGIPGKLHEN